MVVHLRMRRSGLSYIQADLDPDNVKSLVLPATGEEKSRTLSHYARRELLAMHVLRLRMCGGHKEGEDLSVVIEIEP